MECKGQAFQIKKISEDGSFEGYASVFGNIDSDMDIIAQGAFKETLLNRLASGDKPKMLWQHNPEMIVGVWDEFKEDDHGLFVKGRLLADVDKGREALALMRAGALDGMSVGFKTINDVPEGSSGSVRKIIKVDLWEISLVTWGANPKARVTDVKTLKTERHFEDFLRDAGYSRKEAKGITADGFKALIAQRDAGVDEADTGEAMTALLQSINQLKETVKCPTRLNLKT